MYGPDITFAGVPRTTLHALADGDFDIAIVGAPFDGGTSRRFPGSRGGGGACGRSGPAGPAAGVAATGGALTP